MLWTAYSPDRLSPAARALIEDIGNELAFSPVSLWEVVIKRALDRPDFQVDPRALRRGLLENDFVELSVTGDHALAGDLLPPLHKDPFDRFLVAQALAEGLPLVTADARLQRYPGSIVLV